MVEPCRPGSDCTEMPDATDHHWGSKSLSDSASGRNMAKAGKRANDAYDINIDHAFKGSPADGP